MIARFVCGVAGSFFVLGLTARGAQTWDVTLGWARQDDAEAEVDVLAAAATFYLDPLIVGPQAPMNEAAFVERPRALAFSVARGEARVAGVEVDLDAEDYGITYTHRRPTSPHHVRIGYTYGSITSVTTVRPPQPFPPMTSRADSKTHGVRLEYAYYVADMWMVGVRGAVSTQDTDVSTGGGSAVDTGELHVFSRHLRALGGDRWLGLQASLGVRHTRAESNFIEQEEDNLTARLSATYYISRSTGVSLEVTVDDDAEVVAPQIELNHFFNERFAVEAWVGRSFRDAAEDSTVFGLGLQFRF